VLFHIVSDATSTNGILTIMKTKLISAAVTFMLTCVLITSAGAQSPASSPAPASGKEPNILVIMGDDIDWYNPSIYHRGDMGYWTPNIDRIGKEGAMFSFLQQVIQIHRR
jgi:hypothetical protein